VGETGAAGTDHQPREAVGHRCQRCSHAVGAVGDDLPVDHVEPVRPQKIRQRGAARIDPSAGHHPVGHGENLRCRAHITHRSDGIASTLV
jgi:hypothetical protein